MKKETNKIDIEEKVKIKKNKKKKSKLKIIGVVGLLYATLAIGLIDLKTTEIKKRVAETTLVNYQNLENITQDQDSYLNYYNNYNYTEEMFQKDLKRYKNYENFLYEKYKDFAKNNGVNEIVSKERFIDMTNELNYFHEKWNYFKNSYSDMPQFSENYNYNIIIPIFLEIYDLNYKKIKSDPILSREYEEKFMESKNINKNEINNKLYYHNKSISASTPFALLAKEKTIAYNKESIYQSQRLSKDIFHKEEEKISFNYEKLSSNLKELHAERNKYDYKNENEAKKYDEKTNEVMKKEYDRLNYDREYQYNTFKFLNANKALKENIDNLTSSEGEKNLNLLDPEILYPANLVYGFYKDLAKIEENKTYSTNYEDEELIFKILGVEDQLVNKELLKHKNIFIGERTEIYPFLK